MSQFENNMRTIKEKGCDSEILYRIEYIIECVESGFEDIFVIDGVMVIKTSKQRVALMVCWDSPKEVMVFSMKELYSLWNSMMEETYEETYEE